MLDQQICDAVHRQWTDLSDIGRIVQLTSSNDFIELKRLIYEFLKIVGVDMQEREGGKCYIDVPFTLETMPLA